MFQGNNNPDIGYDEREREDIYWERDLLFEHFIFKTCKEFCFAKRTRARFQTQTTQPNNTQFLGSDKMMEITGDLHSSKTLLMNPTKIAADR